MSNNNSSSSGTGYTGNWISVPTGNGFTITLGGWGGGGGGVTNVPAESKKKSDGCNCKKCKEFYPYAEPNQDDGTLVCYSCRHGW